MTLRLLKVMVQPVLVDDDGEHLSEVVAEPIAVSAADWPDFPARLADDIAQQNEAPLAMES